MTTSIFNFILPLLTACLVIGSLIGFGGAFLHREYTSLYLYQLTALLLIAVSGIKVCLTQSRIAFLKNIILVLIMIFVVACATPKNTDTNNSSKNSEFQPLKKFKGDTVSFINSILANKGYYVNKPLNVLLNDLSIPVKRFTMGSNHKNISVSPHITLNIYTQIEIEQKLPKRQDPSSLVIVWAKPLSFQETDSIGLKNGFAWTPEVAEFFGKQIVGDIIKVRYNELK
jgi:hypothetical protein